MATEDRGGYDVDRFVVEVDTEFICAICQGVWRDPVQLKCEHAFCNFCLKMWKKTGKKQCPICKVSISHWDKPLSRQIKNLSDKLRINCDTCSTIVDFGQIEIHDATCGQKIVECSNRKCGKKLYRSQVMAHELEHANKTIVELQQKLNEIEFQRTRDFGLRVGLRVVRGLDWNWGEQDYFNGQPGQGLIIDYSSKNGWVLVHWDNGKKRRYRNGFDGKFDLKLASSCHELLPLLQPGAKVVRGPDWKWGNQDGNSDGVRIGTVIGSIPSKPGWTFVKWEETGKIKNYRVGISGKIDLMLAPLAE